MEKTEYRSPDKFIKNVLPDLKDRFDTGTSEVATFVEANPDSETARDVATALRLAYTEDYNDPDFIERMRAYFDSLKSSGINSFEFNVAFQMLMHTFDDERSYWGDDSVENGPEEMQEFLIGAIKNTIENSTSIEELDMVSEILQKAYMEGSYISEDKLIGLLEPTMQRYTRVDLFNEPTIAALGRITRGIAFLQYPEEDRIMF